MDSSKSENSVDPDSSSKRDKKISNGIKLKMKQHKDGSTVIKISDSSTPAPSNKEDDYDADFPEYYDEEPRGLMKYVSYVQDKVDNFFQKNSKLFKILIIIILIILYHVWLGKYFLHTRKMKIGIFRVRNSKGL